MRWHETPVVIIDFETTGVDPALCAPVQVAAVRYESGQVAHKASSLLNPGCPIPAQATEVHGIGDADVLNAPDPADFLGSLEPLTRDALACGYNGQSYDRVVWERFAAPLGPWLDPLVMVRHVDRYVRGKGRHRLTATCERWGVPLTNAHDALADCLATGALLYSTKMRRLLGDLTVEELIEKQERRREEQDARFQTWLAAQPPRETQGDKGANQ